MLEFLQTQIALSSLLVGIIGFLFVLMFDGWHRTIFNRISREFLPVKQWIVQKIFYGVFLLLSRLPIILKPVEVQKSSNGQALMIKTEVDGRVCHIWVPYQRNLIRSMTGKNLMLTLADETIVFYNLYPGVPFSLTPKQMGGVKAKLINVEGAEFGEFNEDEVIVFR